MFDEKEEDDGVTDNGECPHNYQENETGKINLKHPGNINLLVSCKGHFQFLQHLPSEECQVKLGTNPRMKSFCLSTMFGYFRRRGLESDFSFSLSQTLKKSSDVISPFLFMFQVHIQLINAYSMKLPVLLQNKF